MSIIVLKGNDRVVRATRPLFACLLAYLLSGCATPGQRLRWLLDEAWEAQMRHSPTWATSLGDHRFDDRLADLSLAAHDTRTKELEVFQRRVHAILREQLEPADLRTAELFDRHLIEKLIEQNVPRHLTPLNQLGGPHQALPLLLVSQPFDDLKDYENYIARLRAFPKQIDQAIECMKHGIETGFVPPRCTVAPVLAQIEAHIVDDPVQSEMYKPARQFPETLTDQHCVQLAEQMRSVIHDAVVPAYQRLHDFVKETYLPACRDTVGIWAVDGGDDIYDQLVFRYTTLHKTPDQWHRIGREELRRIHAEMDDVRREVGFEGSLGEFLRHMREDPKYRAPSGQWLMDHYATILERTNKKLPNLFGRLPKAECKVKEIESFRAASAPVAYYDASSPDGSKPGYFYVNTFQPDQRVTYTMESLTYHEAVPGHHFQFALHAENDALPRFRRHNYLTAYCEGWALYTESLGKELGGYTDPLQRFGQLTYDAWRAARLVVDTGIHRLGWTRGQAITFMEENTGLARLNIEKEVDRYIAWPGQALAYKAGEITIRELRAEAEQRLCDSFDIRAFHDRILANGPVPLDILTADVKAWIDGH